jgi:hypothetical protein
LVWAEVIGDVMYQREECLVQASICREKAQADPARYDYWIDQAVVWLQRAAEARYGNAVTHEIHAGRMIPKRAH